MGWGYYELSGGAGFVPETRPDTATAVAQAPADGADPGTAVVPAVVPADSDPLDGVTVVTRADTLALDSLPDANSIADPAAAPDSIAIDADSVADALSQALGEPVLNTGEPEPLPQEEQTASAPPAAANLREVTGDSVNLRDGPGTNFNVVDRLSRGTVISVLDSGPGGWVYVEINGLTGWMSSDFLGPSI
jgi:hypothetical protein